MWQISIEVGDPVFFHARLKNLKILFSDHSKDFQLRVNSLSIEQLTSILCGSEKNDKKSEKSDPRRKVRKIEYVGKLKFQQFLQG